MALNLLEGAERVGRDRKHLFRVALGSAAEVGDCLELAVAWGYVEPAEVATARALVGRVRAMAYRLSA